MSSRRGFIGASVGAAVVAGSAGSPASSAAGPSGNGLYDMAAVAAALQRPARHRQVFAVAKVAGGVALAQMAHSLDAYAIAFGEGPGTLHVAGVFYGRGVSLLLDDETWKAYSVSEGLRRRDDDPGAPAEGNPFLRDPANGASLAAQQKRGATFLACDNALADWAAYFVTVSSGNDRTLDEIHRDLRAHLIPGAMLIPAGVAALNMAQEVHFTYVQATL